MFRHSHISLKAIENTFSRQRAKTVKIYEVKNMSKTKGKKAPPYLYDGPVPDKEDKAEETDDLYDTEERETMLDDDEVTAAEAGFMEGREQEPPSKKQTRKNAISHTDETATELAKEDAEDD